MAQNGVIEAKGVLELVQRFLVDLDVHEHIVGFVHLLDLKGELAPAPVFQPMDTAVAAGHHALVALDHRGHLLALIGMDDKYNFVVSHRISLWVSPPHAKAVGQGVESGRPAGCGYRAPPANCVKPRSIEGIAPIGNPAVLNAADATRWDVKVRLRIPMFNIRGEKK